MLLVEFWKKVYFKFWEKVFIWVCNLLLCVGRGGGFLLVLLLLFGEIEVEEWFFKIGSLFFCGGWFDLGFSVYVFWVLLVDFVFIWFVVLKVWFVLVLDFVNFVFLCCVLLGFVMGCGNCFVWCMRRLCYILVVGEILFNLCNIFKFELMVLIMKLWLGIMLFLFSLMVV